MTPFLCFLLGILPFGAEVQGVRWTNAPAAAARQPSRQLRWEKTIHHPALDAGVWHSGDTAIELRLRGEFFVELFLAAPDGPKHSFRLEAGGVTVDDRYQRADDAERLREKGGSGRMSLIGWVQGPAKLVVRSESPRYQLLALRWTPAAEFHARLVPLWLERARHLHTHPIFEGQEASPKARAEFLEQLHERLLLARNPAVRRESVLGMARAVYWQAAENHEPRDYRRLEAALRECLKDPADTLVRQMIATACEGSTSGGRVMLKGALCSGPRPEPWSIQVPAAPVGAPAWAVEQRRLRLRMEAITRWWVEVRQQPNGELGGAWDDDVEMLRNWGPLAFGLGSPVAARGLERLADGVWNSGLVVDGYCSTIRDVEHSAEPTTDTQPLLAVLHPAEPRILARLKASAACAGNWIARQPDGYYRFRGSWFNCREVDPSPSRAVDVHLNMRAMGPALWFAYLTRDPDTIRLLSNWAESWVRAMRASDAGKPAGRFPSVVWSRDGSYLVNSREWSLPNAEWDYFQWSGKSQEALTSLVLAVYELTGDRKWLDAATESFRDPDPHFLQSPEAFYHWRRLSGDRRYDGFFSPPSADDAGTVLARMAASAREMEQRLAANYQMFTTEPLYTDRIYYQLPPDYRQSLFGGEAPRGDRPPAFAVTWVPDEADYARAVVSATTGLLRLRVYNFQNRPLLARFHVWRLKPGRYAWRTQSGSGTLNLATQPQLVEIPIPPAGETQVEITPHLP